ncbi:uncharacterized protein K444DRAFT_638046 [Hyaloscypha bicolor E]|uniref:Uncharacterized protein n=1 Tax=Hyaloscypha bicolor E TaxID=1095630 RepID=A0A2J6SIW4_9HELO|nr:uncharacterized protein K444DRAFT_638046 [Hyaloscypha bicolor E]PMD50708.1 hypothetical protein K444DRAFT_638046 [Hyaloscypha bicolor E]
MSSSVDVMNIRAVDWFEIRSLCAFSAVLAAFWFPYVAIIQYPSRLPRICEPKGATRFSLRTRLAFLTDCQKLSLKHIRSGRSRERPACSPVWASETKSSCQPTLFVRFNSNQIMSSAHSRRLLNSTVVSTCWRKRETNNILEITIVSLDDELKFTFDAEFSTNTKDWKEFNVLETVEPTVAQGQDEEFLKNRIAYTDICFINAGIIGILPKVSAQFSGLLLNPKSEDDPPDMLQMMLRYEQTNCPDEVNIDDVTGRLALLDVEIFHQANIGIANVVFDIVASD